MAGEGPDARTRAQAPSLAVNVDAPVHIYPPCHDEREGSCSADSRNIGALCALWSDRCSWSMDSRTSVPYCSSSSTSSTTQPTRIAKMDAVSTKRLQLCRREGMGICVQGDGGREGVLKGLRGTSVVLAEREEG